LLPFRLAFCAGVVVVDPDASTVSVNRRLTPVVTSGVDDEIDLDDVVAEFRCSGRDIFG
jgi:hypothetical protein